MKFLTIIASTFLLSASSQAAISITIEPSIPGYSTWTLTQTSPSPDINVTNVWGAGGGISLPVSMFDPVWFEAASSSPITGNLSTVFATVYEPYSNQTFLIETFDITAYPGMYFDHNYVLPNGTSTARFDVIETIPANANIDYNVLIPGVHTIESMFGMLTVTVIPEPSTAVLLAPAALGLLHRRRLN